MTVKVNREAVLAKTNEYRGVYVPPIEFIQDEKDARLVKALNGAGLGCRTAFVGEIVAETISYITGGAMRPNLDGINEGNGIPFARKGMIETAIPAGAIVVRDHINDEVDDDNNKIGMWINNEFYGGEENFLKPSRHGYFLFEDGRANQTFPSWRVRPATDEEVDRWIASIEQVNTVRYSPTSHRIQDDEDYHNLMQYLRGEGGGIRWTMSNFFFPRTDLDDHKAWIKAQNEQLCNDLIEDDSDD